MVALLARLTICVVNGRLRNGYFFHNKPFFHNNNPVRDGWEGTRERNNRPVEATPSPHINDHNSTKLLPKKAKLKAEIYEECY
jgi:hypothetical protein